MIDLLQKLKPTKKFLVCIDSDGCILDNMELKHKECFCPATVNVWNLQGVSRYVREVAEFVNLYSRTRGTNRFPAIVRTLELSYARPELKERGYVLPDLSSLKKWISETKSLSAKAIDEYVAGGVDDKLLVQAAAWSHEVDENIKRIVRNVKPFPYVKEAISALREFADVVVVSATPHDALVRELGGCGISDLVSAIAGQEMGTKSECIKAAMTGKYDANCVLKIGDAPSDLKAAVDNGVFFNPIVPGRETESWKRILEESSKKIAEGAFDKNYMDALVGDFFAVLPENAPWEK